MCIIFIWINDNPAPNEYQLIIASNRDEVLQRPTKPAAKWEDFPHCISGIDLEPHKEGGTWFGVSSHGKIASLVNVASETQPKNEKGRGYLVRDYLTSDKSADSYLKELYPDRHLYGPFHLILIEKRLDKWKICYLGNADDVDSIHTLDTDDIHGFCNCKFTLPWKKLTNGKEMFRKVVQKYPKVEDKHQLQQDLLDLLNDTTPHIPDPQMQSQKGVELTDIFSSINVQFYQKMYGTRTNTLVLVDAAGNGEYLERTMREPINPYEPVWDTTDIKYSFQE